MKKYSALILMLSIMLSMVSCASMTGPGISIYEPDGSLGIETVPQSLGAGYINSFDRYTKITTGSGKAIHIIAQNEISNEKMVRARNILEHYLTDFPGSLYGSDKSAVAEKIAENRAVLLLMNGEDNGKNDPSVDGQPLYDNEIQIEGHSWYINQNYEHRDAAFEEILHFVHDYGIGIDGPNSSPGALPEFQKEIRAAQKNALDKKLWAFGSDQAAWIKELTAENSLSQEYLASVIDSYYGLWGAFKESPDKGMWGLYTAKTREEINAEDPNGSNLMNKRFFHPYLTYNARIDAGFSGTFSLRFDASVSYTNHSRYLKHITLTGKNDSNVRINELNNTICGNKGSNTVIFSGAFSEYTIEKTTDRVTVTDAIQDRDGKNVLKKIEKFQFSDQIITL